METTTSTTFLVCATGRKKLFSCDDFNTELFAKVTRSRQSSEAQGEVIGTYHEGFCVSFFLPLLYRKTVGGVKDKNADRKIKKGRK